MDSITNKLNFTKEEQVVIDIIKTDLFHKNATFVTDYEANIILNKINDLITKTENPKYIFPTIYPYDSLNEYVKQNFSTEKDMEKYTDLLVERLKDETAISVKQIILDVHNGLQVRSNLYVKIEILN